MHEYPKNRIKVPRFEEANGFYTTKDRSKLMSKIRGKDTKPEIVLRNFLWNIGLRYRKNVKAMTGKPDIVMRKYKLVIFVDGEFWHGFKWEEKKDKIKSNRDFWIPKIERNMQRDAEVNQLLEKQGWIVLRFWEQEIKKEFGRCVNEILRYTDYEETF